ncbi:MAG: GPW/gp25 family protein [Acidobacteriota bacterium]
MSGPRPSRGLAFPPHIGSDGRLAWSSGEANVRQNIRVILSTENRERILLPEFGGGLQRFLFEPNNPATHRLIQERIVQALGRWEERIELESVEVAPHSEDPQAAIASIHYRLIATGVADRLDLNVPLAG